MKGCSTVDALHRARVFCLAAATIWPLAAQVTPNPDFKETAVIGAFHREDPSIVHFTTLHRQQVSQEFDLAVIRGGFPRTGWRSSGDLPYFSDGDRLGLFLLSRERPDLAYLIAIDSEPGLGRFEILWAAPRAVVLTRRGDYGFEMPRLKYFFDVESKAFQGKREFSADATVIEGRAGGRRLVPTAAEHAWGVPGVWQECGGGLHFGPRGEYELVSAEVLYRSSLPGCVVRRSEGGQNKTFAASRSTPEEFVAGRPDKQLLHTPLDAYTFNETIGPAQVAEERLWFGLTFYDGEGATGVGGFGWFDVETEQFELIRPGEMGAWSVSAILVEDNAIWFGLKRRPEGAEYSGGLVRWDRRTEEIQRWPDLPLIVDFERDGSRLLAAGLGGGAVLEDGKLQIYFTDVDLDGRAKLHPEDLPR